MQISHFFTLLNTFLKFSMKYKSTFEDIVPPILTVPGKDQN